MTKSRLGWAAALLTAVLGLLDGSPAKAAEGPGNDILKKHGLRIAGSLAVTGEEAELKAKLIELRRLAKELSYARLQQQGTMTPKEHQANIKNIGDQINQLRSELAATNQQMNAIPKYRGRFMSADASMLHAELVSYRNQLQIEINQDSQFLNQLKSRPADPKAKDKVDAEVRDRRDAYHQAILDLRKLVDATTAKYEEAAKNDEVAHALTLLGKGQREKLKLGPSHDFLNNAKLVDKLEKTESSSETDEPQARKTRRSRTKLKSSTKPTAKPAADAAGKAEGDS